MESLENTNIIQRILDGETNLYIHVVRQHERLIYTVVHRVLLNTPETEDLVQEIFIKLYQQLDRFNYKSKFSTWVYRIAYNETIDYLRKQKRMVPMEQIDYALYEDDATESFEEQEQEELLQALEKLLGKMPQDDAFIITLFYLKGLSIAEVGEITGQTVNNVKVRLHRIRKYMYAELKKEGK